MKITDFNLSDNEIVYFGSVGDETILTQKQAGEKVLSVLQDLGCSDWLTKTIMDTEYLWGSILSQETQNNLRRWLSENDDFTVYRLLDE